MNGSFWRVCRESCWTKNKVLPWSGTDSLVLWRSDIFFRFRAPNVFNLVLILKGFFCHCKFFCACKKYSSSNKPRQSGREPPNTTLWCSGLHLTARRPGYRYWSFLCGVCVFFLCIQPLQFAPPVQNQTKLNFICEALSTLVELKGLSKVKAVLKNDKTPTMPTPFPILTLTPTHERI